MAGISVKLPLVLDSELGPYKLNKTLKDSIKQNFKNLLLTNPGERIMDTKFGIGLLTFLFENDTPALRQSIVARINQQTKMYMPFIKIKSVKFIGKPDNIDTDKNSLNIKIAYAISQLNVSDLLDISL